MAWDNVDRRDSTVSRDLVTRTHQRVEDLCAFLLDGQQPGAITRLTLKIEKNKDEAEANIAEVAVRVTSLETSRTWIKGVAATLSGLGTLVAGWFKFHN